MQKTVKEIIEMIDNGQLHYNQSTQRKFVYNDISVTLDGGRGTMTKAGAVINAILEDDVQLPALFFWKNTDTGDLNIHDGKQRILSIYHFVKGDSTRVSTKINSNECFFSALDEEYQEKLLNYKFDIVYREGSSFEEEKSFFLINTNALPLTPYECLSGMFYGRFLKQFEDYIQRKSQGLDSIKPIGRGEQAYQLLKLFLGIENSNNEICNLKDLLRANRRDEFNPESYHAEEKIDLFSWFIKNKISEKVAIDLVLFIDRNFFIRIENIKDLYQESLKQVNDIKSWDVKVHKTFIKRFINDGIKLCPKRFFDKADKDRLYEMYGKCSFCVEKSYSKLEVDHKISWYDGGRTILDNAALLCKHCNTSKKQNSALED